MKMNMPCIRPHVAAFVLGVSGLAAVSSSWACTRLVFQGANGHVITARSMDWKSDIVSNLWVLPRGMQRTGETGPNTVRWTSKYGSVITSGYDISTTDGVNEAGLNANLLWLVESQYPAFGANSKPGLSIAAWAQYVLDNFATVQQAVAALSEGTIHPGIRHHAWRKSADHRAPLHLRCQR
jgi:choloylglycine hydrolase